MKPDSHWRGSKDRYNGGNDKDSFWGMAVLAVIVVMSAAFAAIVFVDTQTGFLAGGLTDDNGAITLARAAASAAPTPR